jgi:predicted ArsR family transcriptional regulator
LAFRELIADPKIGNRAGLARHLGVSRAFVTQSMAVLDAPEAVLEAIRQREAAGRPVTEGLWRRIRRLLEAEAVAALLGCEG